MVVVLRSLSILLLASALSANATLAQEDVRAQIAKKLQKHMKSKALSIAMVRGKFTIRVNSRNLFKTSKPKPAIKAKQLLADISKVLTDAGSSRFQVRGHTEQLKNASISWKLSGEMALEVVKSLLASGLPPERISFAGYGHYQPIAPNDSKENRAQNRRIEIVMIEESSD